MPDTLMESSEDSLLHFLNVRRKSTLSLPIGEVTLGGGAPILLQSMTTTRANDVLASVEATLSLVKAGASLVRITAPSALDACCFEQIREKLGAQGCRVPLVADIHYSPQAAMEAARWVEKIRINPGNYAAAREASDPEDYRELLADMEGKLIPLLEECEARGVAVRVGVNHGSLAPRVVARYGAGVEGMVAEAMEVVEICATHNFRRLIFSLKASDVPTMVLANRKLREELDAKGWHFPLHLGVTEAGDAMQGRVKSAVGIGTLLLEGVGDTIRVSLTGAPEDELDACREIVNTVDIMERDAAHFPRSLFSQYEDLRAEGALPSSSAVLLGTHARGLLAVYVGEDALISSAFLSTLHIEDAKSASGGDLSPDLILLSRPEQCQAVERLNLPERLMQRLVGPGEVEDCSGYAIRIDRSFHLKVVYCQAEDLLKGLPPDALYALCPDLIVVESAAAHPLPGWVAIGHLRARRAESCSVPLFYHYLPAGRLQSFSQRECHLSLAYGGGLIAGFYEGLVVPIRSGIEAYKSISCGYHILQCCGLRRVHTEYISCPSCGRTLFNISERLQQIKAVTQGQHHLRIGVMGCIVNGPGEMRGADYGYVGAGPGKVSLYRGDQPVRKGIPEEEAVDALVELIKADGMWRAD